MQFVRNILKAFVRRKPIETSDNETQLKRCLGPIDLTALGIGSTLGVGVYVITGTVAANQSGPSVVISFLIAAISSIFAGLCYAEFGALVPKAGSAYVYSYISVGELMAYVIGWNLILEYIIGTASVARSYSNYLDYLCNNRIQNFFLQYISLPKSQWFSTYPDILAFSITMLLSIMLTIGIQESTRVNTIFTCVNILVIIYCIIVGLFKIDFTNWNIDSNVIPAGVNGGDGGYFPFGIRGMISGAATCFYSFVGFDAIATTGEEVINPQRDIPIGIVLSLSVVTLAYCAVSAIQTLMWPYWDQNQKAPLPYVFDQIGFPFAKNVIAIGALAGLSTSLLGSIYPLPRILYAMANDSLLFRFLANINPRLKTPVIATVISGLFSALMAMFFDVEQLAEMMSIGTLLAYSLVAISILILRYKVETNTEHELCYETKQSLISKLLNLESNKQPNRSTSRICLSLIVTTCILILAFNLVTYLNDEQMYNLSLSPTVMIIFAIIILALFALIIMLSRQPMVQKEVSFKVPLVPLVPLLSVFANTYLMVHLNHLTWLRFIVWMAIGFVIYFSYGIRYSVGYKTKKNNSNNIP